MKKQEIIGGLFWLAAGLFFTGLSATYDLGSLSQPGPGLLPLALGILLSLLSVAILVRTRRLSGNESSPLFTGRWRRVALSLAALMVAVFFFETAGYLLTFLFLGLVLPMLTGWIGFRG